MNATISSPGGTPLNKIVYGNGVFVAIGNNAIYSTTDGRNWTPVPSDMIPPSTVLQAIAFGDGKFVIEGWADNRYQVALISTDGLNWEAHSQYSGPSITDLAYGNGQWVGHTALTGYVYRSPDGVDWTIHDLHSVYQYNIAYGNGTFATVGNGFNFTSTDGANWTPHAQPTAGSANFRGLVYGNGKFVAVGDGVILYSSDGANWSYQTANINGNYGQLKGLTFGGGRFVAIDPDWGVILTSTDGANWSYLPPSFRVKFINSIAYGNGQFVGVGSGGVYTAALPELQTATVQGASLALAYSRALDTGSIPSPSDFSVIDHETSVPVIGVSITGSTVTLVLAQAIPADDKVTLSYSPGSNPIQTVPNTLSSRVNEAVGFASVEVPLSSNANLNNLTLSEGTLDPAFDSDTTSYTVNVTNDVDSIQVTPSAAERHATVTVNGDVTADGNSSTVPLEVGTNRIHVIATAQNGNTTKLYTITVNREAPPLSSDNDLSDLEISDGILNPVFNRTTTSYTVTVTNSVYQVTVTPTVSNSNAVVKVNGTEARSGQATTPIGLSVGPNPITVAVTAQDGTAKTYTIEVTRQEAASGGHDPSDLSPPVLTATAGDGQVTLNWSAVQGAVTYSVYEGTASGSYGTAPAATVTGSTSYTATGLANGTTYYFAVKASNEGDSSGYSNEAAATPEAYTPEPYLSVIYNGNGAASGTVPIDSTPYSPGPGVMATVYGNTGNLVKPGYSFGGWNTQADGEGTNFHAGDTFGMGSSNVILYANWTINAYTVGFNSNGGSAIDSQSVKYKDAANQPIAPTRDGYTFGGWYSDSGLTVSFDFSTPITADTILYAKWTVSPPDGSSDGSESGGDSEGGSGGGGGGGGDSLFTSPTNTVTSKDGTLTLPIGQSGDVTLGDEVRIVIPADAAGRDLQLTINKVADTQKLFLNNEVLASSVFEILKNFPESFNKEVALTFTFDPKSLKNDRRPSVFYYDEAKKTWVEIGGTVNGNTITVKVIQFNKYAVLAAGQGEDSAVDKKAANFSDISKHWAEANIKQAVSLGIVSGYSDGTFKPDHTVTRAEFAVMLMNALKPEGDSAAMTFTDTATIGDWARESVAQAVNAGIIAGYRDGTFRPEAEITRAEMATMIAKALGQPIEAKAATGFADDADLPEWAKGAVAAMKKRGIIKGKDANAFAPHEKTTRAEAVTVLLKMLAQKGK